MCVCRLPPFLPLTLTIDSNVKNNLSLLKDVRVCCLPPSLPLSLTMDNYARNATCLKRVCVCVCVCRLPPILLLSLTMNNYAKIIYFLNECVCVCRLPPSFPPSLPRNKYIRENTYICSKQRVFAPPSKQIFTRKNKGMWVSLPKT